MKEFKIGTDGFTRRKKMITTDGFTRRKNSLVFLLQRVNPLVPIWHYDRTDGFTRRKKMFFFLLQRVNPLVPIWHYDRTDGFTRRTAIFLFLLSFHISIFSQQNYRITPDVVYGHKAGMALTFDVFTPDSANGAGIIHIVSGSWISRYYPPDSAVTNYKSLLDEGYTVFALRHGSNPQFKLPETVADIILGSAFIHQNAGMFGVDSTRLGVFGGSSGGQLALMAALSGEKHPVSAIVAFYPPADLRRVPDMIKAFIPALDFDTTLAASVSPVTFASPDDPPTLLIHGDKDFVVQPWQSEKMYAALQENNVISRLIIYEGMGHGNLYGAKGEYYEEANREMLEWFNTYLSIKTNSE